MATQTSSPQPSSFSDECSLPCDSWPWFSDDLLLVTEDDHSVAEPTWDPLRAEDWLPEVVLPPAVPVVDTAVGAVVSVPASSVGSPPSSDASPVVSVPSTHTAPVSPTHPTCAGDDYRFSVSVCDASGKPSPGSYAVPFTLRPSCDDDTFRFALTLPDVVLHAVKGNECAEFCVTWHCAPASVSSMSVCRRSGAPLPTRHSAVSARSVPVVRLRTDSWNTVRVSKGAAPRRCPRPNYLYVTASCNEHTMSSPSARADVSAVFAATTKRK